SPCVLGGCVSVQIQVSSNVRGTESPLIGRATTQVQGEGQRDDSGVREWMIKVPSRRVASHECES
ncbi:MAG: hypothetical protein QF464_01955, partial [Myxococcota bacterium]|nr:hypothetical protein [Myxococcota bacterium]